jgi:putative molybdopterin biosynthesis protein
MWAERQAQVRLAPQIEALRSDLERAFAVAFDESAHVLTLYASHDDALAACASCAEHPGRAGAPRRRHGPLHLDIRFCGSVDAIRALNEGRCEMAGFHTLQRPHRARWRPHLQAAAQARPAQDHRICQAHAGTDRGTRQSAGPVC